jgi:spermidine synthase
VLTFDYLGALAVSLLFPLVLAPYLGLVRTGFLFGMLNVGVALWTIRCFPHRAEECHRAFAARLPVMCVLVFGFAFADKLTYWGEHGLFGDEIVFATTTPYQRLVITRWKDDLRLYINGNLQFSSRDEYRYHEALVHPVLQPLPWAKRVLVLGGGDGLALREILRYPNIEHVTLVDLDPAMTGAFTSARNWSSSITARSATSACAWSMPMRRSGCSTTTTCSTPHRRLPDPSSFALGKLYSVPFYGMVKKHLAANGLMVVQSTSPFFAPHAYWTIDATLREVGMKTYPYHAYVPSFGEWGFILATPQASTRRPPATACRCAT